MGMAIEATWIITDSTGNRIGKAWEYEGSPTWGYALDSWHPEREGYQVASNVVALRGALDFLAPGSRLYPELAAEQGAEQCQSIACGACECIQCSCSGATCLDCGAIV